MAIDKDYLILYAKELKGEAPERLDLFIGLATDLVNQSFWGTKSDHATALMAAHMITNANRRGNSMTVSSKVGDIQRQYQSQSEVKNWLSTSSYGQMYIYLMRTRVVTPYIVGDDGNNNPGNLPYSAFGFTPP